MTDPINLLDEASWLDFPAWRDDDPLSACVEDGRTVGDLRRLLALARDAEGLRAALHIGETWPEAISDGLTLPCADCGEVPRFDFHVNPEFWSRWVPGPERTGVICLPCLDRRSGGVGLAAALGSIQWTGTGHTVVLEPSRRYEYATLEGTDR